MNRRQFVTGTVGSAAILRSATPAGSQEGVAPRDADTPSPDSASPKRVLFLAVDGMDPAIVERFISHLPNIRRLQTDGFSGRVLPYVSCWGNMDFMSMLTGAAPGTQYRTSTEEKPRHRQCVSETIWHVLESEGRRSFLIDFPGSVASEGVAVIPVGAATISRPAIHQTSNVAVESDYRQNFETTGWPPGGGPKPGRQPSILPTPVPASGWSSPLPSRRPVLETVLRTSGRRQPRIEWPVLVAATESNGYDTVVVYGEKNGRELTRLHVGSWSPWVNVEVTTGFGPQTGMVRFRLLELDPSGSQLQLLQSALCATEGFCQPVDLSNDLVEELGPFWRGSAIAPTPKDPYWEVGEEEAVAALQWVADAAIRSLESWNWDFFLHKVSLVDTAMHQCLTPADPTYYRYDPEEAQRYEDVYRRAYIDLDTVIGRLADAVSQRDDTVLIIGSDHGGGVNNTVCDIDRRLQETGLQEANDSTVNWSKTRAYTKRRRQGTEVFVNLMGREPQGIVSPEDYEQVQEKIIDALLDWRCPRTGQRTIAYALKLRDAALIGYWGHEAGDVQFAYNPGFVWGVNPDGSAIAPSRSPISNHGPQIVTASTGFSSMMGYLLAWGPGVARGVRRDERAHGPIPIASVAPTLSRLLACRLPKDCQLGYIQELLA